ncbi:hypothetical protein LTS17_005280 [Exophiala oligosperma]
MVPANPIIPGFAPDPSIIRVADTYFLVNSTFHFFPGIPVYASKDLVSWQHIGDAFNRHSQLKLSNTPSKISQWDDKRQMVGNRGLYAPTIRWHAGTFYIIVSNILDDRSGPNSEVADHLIISTNDIYANIWSDPIHWEYGGGDPSLFFEDDHVYVQIASAKDASVHQFEIDIQTGKRLSEPKSLWKGTGRPWLESPHVYKKDGYYYLLVAEGGCFEQHVISIARSENLWGPYEGCPANPILTAFNTTSYIQNVGHGELVEDINGAWWVVVLGVRQTGNSFVLGRESFITSVEWLDSGWPKISPVAITANVHARHRELPQPGSNGAVTFSAVSGFLHIRGRDDKMYTIGPDGQLTILPSNIDLLDPEGSPTFIGVRQKSLEGTASTSMRLPDIDRVQKIGLRTGLAMYKEEHRFIRIFYDSTSGEICFEAFSRLAQVHLLNRKAVDLHGDLGLRLRYTELVYHCEYRLPGSKEYIVLGSIDSAKMSNLDFVGPVIGVFAVANDVVDGNPEVHFTGLEVD